MQRSVENKHFSYVWWLYEGRKRRDAGDHDGAFRAFRIAEMNYN